MRSSMGEVLTFFRLAATDGNRGHLKTDHLFERL
jgi:hypothetical protein